MEYSRLNKRNREAVGWWEQMEKKTVLRIHFKYTTVKPIQERDVSTS